MVVEALENVKEDTILWTSSTSPFLGPEDYLSMLRTYEDGADIDSLVGVYSKHDYVYYKKRRLNFSDKFANRDDLTPIRVMTNGCYIIQKDLAIERASLYSEDPFLYELDYLSAIEIKDVHTYQISRELISSYFQRELNV